MTLFPHVRGERSGDRFMNQFMEALSTATPAEMAEQVLSACQFIEGFRRSPENEDRVNNATYAICTVVNVLAGRTLDVEVAADDRVHAEAEKIRANVKESPVHRPKGHQVMLEVADDMDPYHVVDGKLVRKSDGKPVIL